MSLRAGGMTLVELLVAIAILALISVMGWRALDAIARAQDALQAQTATLRGHQLAFLQIQADCARVAASATFDGQPTLLATPGRLMLLRRLENGAGPDQFQIVVYQVRDGALVRSASAPIRDLDRLHAAWTGFTTGRVHFDGATLDARVASFEIHTWSGGAWVQGDASAWPARLPTRRVVRAPVLDAAGLQVTMSADRQASAMVRAFIVGPG